MSDNSSAPLVVSAAKFPRKSVMIASAAAFSVAAIGGAVFGFSWSGGGEQAVAEPPAAIASVAAPAPVMPGVSSLPGNFADIVERVSPAVVSIKAKVSGPQVSELKGDELENIPPGLREYFEKYRRAPDRAKPRGGEVQGSGFVVDSTGFMVTNNHVIADATDIEVNFVDGKKFKAKLIGRDPLTDIAVLKIQGGSKFPFVSFGDDRSVRVGDWVLAVGNPFGLGGTVTAGIVSARGRDEVGGAQFTDFLQIDASINRGNSGGPAFDLSGRVIGMNTAIFSPSGGSVGIGFAIPSTTVQRVVAELKNAGSVTRGWLGVKIQSLDDDYVQSMGLANTNGALVNEVVEASPAAKAGFKHGDVVLKMDGQSIKDNRDLSRRVAALQVGQHAKFTVWRDNRESTISVTIAKRPGEEALVASDDNREGGPGAKPDGLGEAKVAALGLDLAMITPTMRSDLELSKDATGMLITNIDPDSDAAERGLQPGDRIVKVGANEVHSIADVNSAIATANALKRPSVLLFVERGNNQKVFIPVKLKKIG
ncbi:MAG: Do family serine endopeptidase [Alphaproteobacteria bacterium]|nr:Do family serine endopeptidase [Alphaproteobacteria bacterium]